MAGNTRKERPPLHFSFASRVLSRRLHFIVELRNHHEISQLSQLTMARDAIIPSSLAITSSSGRVRLRKSDQPRGLWHMPTATIPTWLEGIERISEEIIAPAAAEIDGAGAFPRAAITAMGKAGLLGLVSGKEVGGLGEGH